MTVRMKYTDGSEDVFLGGTILKNAAGVVTIQDQKGDIYVLNVYAARFIQEMKDTTE